jgi:hypothetical protein
MMAPRRNSILEGLVMLGELPTTTYIISDLANRAQTQILRPVEAAII